MIQIFLSPDEIKILTNLANNVTASPSLEPDLFCEQVKELSHFIPQRIEKELLNFIKFGGREGFLIIKTIPIENIELIITPPGNNNKIGEKTSLAKIQAILIHVIGDMIAYEAEGYGRLFQDVVPMKSMETLQTSVSSNVELEIHTEQAFSKLRPDVLSLACIRGDSCAFTHILPVEYILQNLTEKECALLREPLWNIGVDLSFKLNGNEFIEGDIRGPMPILSGSTFNPNLIFDQDLMFGITENANKIIQKIVNIYHKYKLTHSLVSGEITFIDNRKAVHGRSSFFPKYDGRDRFLVRCFATFDYEKSQYARPKNSRTISAIYS